MASLSERVAAAKAADVSIDSQRDGMFRELRGRLHFKIVEELGPTLYDRQMSDAELRLRVLEMLEWALDQEQNLPLSRADRTELISEIASDVLGYGPIDPLLNDPEVTEVMVNGPHQVFIER
ncbi:MAG: CpaF family protein, partial [Acidimicrobiia bacterium]